MSFVAVITGASSGIGEATARRLCRTRPDAEVILVARRTDRVDAIAAELNAEGGHAHAYGADLTDPDAVAGLARWLADSFGQLHLLVNNAGARWSKSFAEGGHANVAQTMAINFDAQVRVTEALLPQLRAAVAAAGPRAGSSPANVSIVNVASTAGRVARAGTSAYSASKFALIGWSDSLHLELKAEGIHVGVVNPGFISTEGFPQTELVNHPVRRHLVGTVEQAAEAVLAAGPGGRAEVYVPRFYWAFAATRLLAPGLIRRLTAGETFTPKTAQDAAPTHTS